jgi:hypothetical protein
VGVRVSVGVCVSVGVEVREEVSVGVRVGVSVQEAAVAVRLVAVRVACCSAEGPQAVRISNIRMKRMGRRFNGYSFRVPAIKSP